MAFLPPCRVVIRGGGEMGSGVAWRLFRCGYQVIIAETKQPTAIRRWVCFSEAVYEGKKEIEGVTSRLCTGPDAAQPAIKNDCVAIVIAPDPEDLEELHADVIVDAMLAKRGGTTPRGIAKRTIGLGPGFVAGADVDCVIETNRGPDLGRCIWIGSAESNTGTPGLLGGESSRRVLRAPVDGTVEPLHEIGQSLRAADTVARVEGSNVAAQIDGILRGMLRAGLHVAAGTKIGDIDPRADIEICRRISDKALAIAGGVLEAVLSDPL